MFKRSWVFELACKLFHHLDHKGGKRDGANGSENGTRYCGRCTVSESESGNGIGRCYQIDENGFTKRGRNRTVQRTANHVRSDSLHSVTGCLMTSEYRQKGTRVKTKDRAGAMRMLPGMETAQAAVDGDA